MDVAIVGPDPAATALREAFTDIDANVMEVEVGLLDGFDFAVVVGTAGEERFRTANELIAEWIAIEIGGAGGRPIEEVDATVTLFSEDSGCYDCLVDRVRANVPDEGATPQGTRSAVRFAGALAGRRAIQQFGGADLGGTLVEVPGVERSFLPVPGCDCGDAPEGFELAHREVDLDDAVDRMDRAVDGRLGLVTEVGERESFPLPYYIARTTDTTAFADARCAEFAAGVSPDWDAAYAKAIGEALERYCAGVYRASDLRTGPTEGVVDAVPVDRFVRPEDASTPDPDDHLAWVPGVTLGTGERVSLPAEFVHFPPPERRHKPPITTGLGLGNSTVEATLSGLYEAVERDATMLAWYSTFEPLGLDVDDEGFRELVARARAEDLSVTPLLCTQDVDVPVVAAAVHREGDWPRFAMGSAADLDAGAAAADAAAEALQNWMELRAMGPERADEEEGAIGTYAGFPDDVRPFVEPDATIPAADVGERVSGEAELDALLGRLDATGLDAHAAQLTTRDVAALGFEAVRVLVPAAQPLFTGEPFFGERLGRVAESMGFEPRPDRAYHPFP
ncbi:YcaO-like family protein [Halorarum salinum]|uniref:YcaO-like family protein n=1 Tax=Halorarum salinum TaxID=2743089 RepID=A0A7D5LBL1_9EURY|nr:YcaO-like family protein [Halobaculum salinum]QLG62654.1 YcaO-like family protein [Halobaculum salinum]